MVLDYRQGVKGASEKLVVAFEPLIRQYVRLCKDGSWNRESKSISKFIKMMGLVRHYSTQGSSDQALSENAADIDESQGIVEALVAALRGYSEDDIRQEAVMALLTTALKYTNISANYCYVFKRQLKELISDPLLHATSQGRMVELYPDYGSYRSIQDDHVELNAAWVAGLTIQDKAFTELTALQRAILKMSYQDGRTQKDIAQMLSLKSENVVRHERLEAIRILAKFFK